MSNPQEMTHLFRDAWKVMSSRFPTSFYVDEGGLATCFADVPLFFLNLSIYDGEIPSAAEFERILTRASERAKRSQHGWLYGVSSELTAPGWESVAEAHGFATAMVLTGMVAPELTPATRPLPAVEFRAADSDQTYADIANLNAAAYGVPAELFECMANGLLWQSDSYACVAYVDGIPVSAAAAFPVNGTIYIALVATSPEHRGKGYAEATFRKVVEQARKIMGPGKLTLHATEAGGRLYQEIGFEHIGKFTLLVAGGAH